MATPLEATHRIRVEYTVSGMDHQFVAYCRGVTPVGGSYNINTRTLDENDLDWEDAANALMESISYVMSDNNWTPGSMLLESYDFPVWNPIATGVFTGTDHAAGTVIAQGSQVTLTLRDKLFKKVRVIVLDIGYHGAFRSTIFNYFGDARDTFMKQWCANFTVSNAPYNWQVGRSNQYLATNPLVAYVQAYNKKIRRGHSIA